MTVSEFVNKVGFKVKDEDVKKVNSTISDIKSTATKVLGAIGIGFSLVSVKNLIEEFGQVNNQINYAAGGLEAGAEAQKKILEAANNCRGTYSEIAAYASKLSQANSSLFPVDDAAKFVEYTTKLGKAAGYNDSVISSTHNTLNKVIAAGKMGTGELQNLSENAPAVINTICNRLGVTKEQLQSMAAEGTLSAQTVKEAMLNSAGEIDDAFSNVNITISDAIKNIRNRWGQWLAETDQMLGVTRTIAKTMVSGFNAVMSVLNRLRTGVVWLSEKLGGTEKLIKLLAIVAGSLFVAFKFDKIKSGFKMITSMLKASNGKALAIAAVIILIALLVEDFVNFIKGNNSLLGTFLKKMGINADEVREKFKGFGKQLKELGGVLAQLGSQLMQALVEVLGVILTSLMELIIAVLPAIIDLISQIIPFIVQIIQQLLPVLINLITQIIPIIMQIIKQILPVVINLISQILPLILQLIENLLPVIIDLINRIIPIVLQIIEAILPVIIDLINELTPIMVQIIESILPIIIDLINTLIPIIMEIIEAILPVIIELINQIIPIVSEIIQAILPILIELINQILPLVTEIIQAILPVILQIINALLPLFMQIVNSILPLITTLIKALLPVIQPIISLIANLAQTILPVIVSVLNAIIPIINTIAEALGPVFDIIGLIVDAIAKVVGWVASGLGWIVDLFFGGGGDSEKAKEVAGYASGSDNTEDTFIAGEEGPELITGQKGKKVFTASETGSIFDMVNKLANAKVPSPTTANTVSNNVESKSIVQNVNINNEFNGDKAIQRDASKAMNRSAEDVTSQLARGLAYSG